MPKIKIHDTETNEVIEREMTKAELAEWKLNEAQNEALKEATTEAEAKKEALLQKLGLTAEEAKLLLS